MCIDFDKIGFINFIETRRFNRSQHFKMYVKIWTLNLHMYLLSITLYTWKQNIVNGFH